MAALKVGYHLLLLELLLAFPLAWAGWAGFGRRGILVAFLLVAAFLVFLSLRSEQIILKIHGAKERLQLDFASKVFTYSQPVPNLLMARSWGTNGVVLLSQGILALLSENEIRAVLAYSIRRLKDPEFVIVCIYSILAFWILSLAPRQWVQSVVVGKSVSKLNQKLTPFSFLLFLLFYPFSRWLVDQGAVLRNSSSADLNTDRNWIDAMRKINQTQSLFQGAGVFGEPALVNLYLVSPSGPQAILPLDACL